MKIPGNNKNINFKYFKVVCKIVIVLIFLSWFIFLLFLNIEFYRQFYYKQRIQSNISLVDKSEVASIYQRYKFIQLNKLLTTDTYNKLSIKY
jgi:quinol-cytochrome oxidoreductase complex cytochrome b subunit